MARAADDGSSSKSAASAESPAWWSAGASFLRDADWLTPARARAWCVTLAVVSGVFVIVWHALSHHGLDQMGRPLGYDFISFYSAARLALAGHAGAPYDQPVYAAAQMALFPDQAANAYRYPYPPPFLLLSLPFGALPYFVALAAWVGVGLTAFVACVRRILPARWAVLAIFAFPGVLTNAVQGHNGFLSAVCLAGTLLLLDRRPFGAGAALGVLVFKPHLVLAAPFAFIASRRWGVLAGAAASALVFCALSWLVLGRDAWLGFLHTTAASRQIVELPSVREEAKMQSVFAAVRLLGGSVDLAYALQGLVVVGVLAVLVRAVARRPGPRAEGALFVIATLLCPPYVRDYDLVCLALPMAWVASEAARTGWRPWEKSVLLAAYVLPLVSPPLAAAARVPVAPAVLLALFAVVARRVGERCDAVVASAPSDSAHGAGT